MREYEGDDPVSFVVSLNLHRRHLSESQRGLVARRLSTVRQGARTDLELRANLPEVSQAQAAELLNVSERTVKTAGKVLDHGAPELVSAVESGVTSVSAAADVAELPRQRQQEIVARGPDEIMKFARQIRRERKEQNRAEQKAAHADAAKRVPPRSALYQIHLGSCTDAFAIGAESVDCIITDPPLSRRPIHCKGYT